MTQSEKEINLIRELARKVAEIANEPRMEVIHRRWRDVIALRKPDRPPVYCRPVGCWPELLPPESLVCREPWRRDLEFQFRQVLVKRDIDDDTPVEPFVALPAVFDVEPQNTWGVQIGHHQPDSASGAWAYDPPLKGESDFAKLQMPVFRFNSAKTREQHEKIGALLDGILPVKITADVPLSATLGTAAADLRGLEQMMLDMIAEPHLMHRLMAFLRDAVLAAMDEAETAGVLTPNNNGAMTCSDPIGAPEGGHVRFKNMWCMANSQEFDQVSPAMWEEFCLNYQKPIFERYGLVGYGCCENLTRKIDGVLTIPNLRIFTCSAWTDLALVLEKVGRRYCIMWRQKASDVVFPDDIAGIRKDLEEGARRLRGHYYQVVLRELQTLAGHPDRLHVWTALAKEAVSRY